MARMELSADECKIVEAALQLMIPAIESKEKEDPEFWPGSQLVYHLNGCFEETKERAEKEELEQIALKQEWEEEQETKEGVDE